MARLPRRRLPSHSRAFHQRECDGSPCRGNCEATDVGENCGGERAKTPCAANGKIWDAERPANRRMGGLERDSVPPSKTEPPSGRGPRRPPDSQGPSEGGCPRWRPASHSEAEPGAEVNPRLARSGGEFACHPCIRVPSSGGVEAWAHGAEDLRIARWAFPRGVSWCRAAPARRQGGAQRLRGERSDNVDRGGPTNKGLG